MENKKIFYKKVFPKSLRLISLVLLFCFSCGKIDSQSQIKGKNLDVNKKNKSLSKPKLGEIRKNFIGMELVYIPKGKFLMGSSDNDLKEALIISKKYNPNASPDWMKDESPQRQIEFKKGFWIGKYEVTQKHWKAVMNKDIRQQRDEAGKEKAIRGEGENYPIYYVNWEDAKEFIERLNKKDKEFQYSLPTEAEWEYSARANTKTNYYWGDDLNITNICKYANVADKSAKEKFTNWKYISPCRDNFAEIAPVGKFRPNDFGLYDMSGNVWEWCEDFYKDSYKGLPKNGSANVSLGNPNKRVLRGGSWYDFVSDDLRSAGRGANLSTKRLVDIGFRVVARPKIINAKK